MKVENGLLLSFVGENYLVIIRAADIYIYRNMPEPN